QIQTTEGKTIEGHVLGEGFYDLQLRTADHRVLLLRRAGSRFREVTSDTDWPTYNGEPGGNRYTKLTQISQDNIAHLAMTWMFTLPGAGPLEVTPVVVGGMMYVTGPNECFALDAGSGREIWHYKRRRTGTMSVGGGANRGVAVAGDRVFMEPTMRTSLRSTVSPANCCGIRSSRTRAKTTLQRRRLFRRGTWSSRASVGASTARTDSSQLTIRRLAGRSGDFQPSRGQENQDQRRGKGRISSMAALRPGLPGVTTPSLT